MAKNGGVRPIWPVLMAGGTGTRLWPASRELFPKQFMALTGDATMFEQTARRLAGPLFGPPVVLCNDEHRFIAAEQLRAAAMEPAAIILEPAGRNTAPAAAVAALYLVERDAEAVMLLAPADHLIADVGGLIKGIELALPAALGGSLVTFGIPPDRAETGYGYIEQDQDVMVTEGVSAVASFTEKPDADTARQYLASGHHYWNSGIFLMGAASYLSELERLRPEILAAARSALENADADLDFLRLDRQAFEAAPNISIDYAVMEPTDKGAVLPLDIGWSDVGSWAALWEMGEKDGTGNVLHGDVEAFGVSASYLRSDKGLLAVVGLDDIVVVVTDDTVLVAPKNASQEVKTLVERLKRGGRSEPLTHTTTYRPWGSFRNVDAGAGYQVKRITVKPGGRLSLQKHARRAEHWVVVVGTATVTRGEEVVELHANQSTYIPIGMAHRLENRTEEELHLIEVQSGDYLGEDDIERLEDIYGRS
ncbi:MAG: mannose-1-phosphate guanylyltransferase/mannose-6-phosphate isomerase [Alphaproteobacteria bacterium]|nr:mannose-1-phosphate guanylyltransferase/mannose-6-phosphate isomerase [Alphaproteobacteria bacterium]MCZ6610310.1 mannose-1-phosphate guanylyltransferase/mannose-6-phosphate isomerase [Alphaproteobacteria bacterium]